MALKKYKVVKGNIYGVQAGSVIELEEKEAKARGPRYVEPAKAEKKAPAKKATPKTAENKAVAGDEVKTK